MDGDDRRVSQYGQPYQPPGSSRPPPGQPLGPPTTDRFALPATPVRSDPTRHSMTRPYMPGYPNYSYQDPQYGSSSLHGSSPMQGVEMQYSPAYVQDVSRQQAAAQAQPHQQYAQYAQGSILPSAHPQAMYEQIPAYQQRQSAAIEVMTSQLGAIPQYIQHQEQQGLQLQPLSSHYGTSQAEQAQFPSAGMPRTSLQSQYSASASDYGASEQQTQQQAAQQSAAEQEALQEGFRDYEQQLRITFDAILAGRVSEASEKIVPLSRWLAASVVPLGLHHDNEAQYADRLNLWRRFNLCWEALGQKQRDICEDALRTRRTPTDMLSADTMHRMIDELLTLCDQLEQYGLVDYELGVAEEQITHIFTVCLDLLQRPEFGSQSRPPTR